MCGFHLSSRDGFGFKGFKVYQVEGLGVYGLGLGVKGFGVFGVWFLGFIGLRGL